MPRKRQELTDDVFEDQEEEELKGRFEESATGRSPLDLPSDFEDEEIDEDEAFGEEDYAKFGDLKDGNKGGKGKPLNMSLSEESESEEDGGTLLSEFLREGEEDENEADDAEKESERYEKMMSSVLPSKEKKRAGREELPVDPFLGESEYNVRPTGMATHHIDLLSR